jgi:predicted RNA-binding protein with RPS1 domain
LAGAISHEMPLHEGQIVTGRVIEFVGAGAKIALSPRLHANLSPKNLSWKRKYGQNAKDYFDLDNEVLVKILEIKNREDKKPHIQVGFRETEPNPWEQAAQLHPPQSKARGVVCFHLPFGVMVELPTETSAKGLFFKISVLASNASGAKFRRANRKFIFAFIFHSCFGRFFVPRLTSFAAQSASPAV